MSLNKGSLKIIKENKQIDEISLEKIQEYNNQLKKWNIKIHKICIYLLIVINIIIIVFLFLFKYQIKLSSQISLSLKSQISIEEKIQKDYIKKTNSMLVNSFRSKYFKELTTILKDLSELNQIKDMIILNEKKDKKHIREEIHLFFLISSSTLHMTCDLLRKQFEGVWHKLILMETVNGKKIGIFLQPEYIDDLYLKDKNGFLFSLNNNKTYNIKYNSDYVMLFPRYGDILFNIGNGDLIVPVNFKKEKYISEFPKFFDNNDAFNPFLNVDDDYILEIEVYSIFFYKL
jgi:hypothetical protein